ncbi:MAG: 23S rRNA (uracil(1939)-C(5))-methyltransferase RlmD [Lachnospiraceae bacterium]|nr:23S rRNA (uracil(1939)-C(5))-methyltransferase RlmD [Lachnospiraceae bacterium]
MEKSLKCPVNKRCGSCTLLQVPYEKQLENKTLRMRELLEEFCEVKPIIGMEDPLYYRNKVHHVFGFSKKGILSGSYKADSHHLVNIDHCFIEDKESQEIIHTIRDLVKSFKITIYDEDTGYGTFRHVLVRRGFYTGEIMVVLVMADPVFPGKNNFIKALLKKHPAVTTIIQNINNRDTSMVLGKTNKTLYGPGFIKDRLADCVFRISPASFYQVNSLQAEVLYRKAAEFASLSGKETVVDAYCGVGTIGLSVAKRAKQVIGVELNPDAVKDAIINARENKIENARFYARDAGDFLTEMAARKERADVVILDPPRSGSTEKFLKAVDSVSPKRIVYVSCEPETLKRDLVFLKKLGWQAMKIQPVDMFPFTENIECCVLLERMSNRKAEKCMSAACSHKSGTLTQ